MASEAFWHGINDESRRAISKLIPPEQIEDQLPPMVHVQPVRQRQALLISILDACRQAHEEDARQGQDSVHIGALHAMAALQTEIGNFASAEATYRQLVSCENVDQLDLAAHEGLVRALAGQGKHDTAATEIEQLSQRMRSTQGEDSPDLLICSQMAARNKEEQLSTSHTSNGVALS